MTYHELVKKVQTALAKADASKVEEHIAVQVNVTGEAEGAFYMAISGGVLYVEPYDYKDRDALLTADGADVLAVAEGKISLEAAIAEGKVGHEGNYEKTLALGATIPAKKAAVKKAAPKKTEEKAEEKAPAAKETKPAAKKAAAKKAAPAAEAKAEVKAEAKTEAPAKKTAAKKTTKKTK